MGTKKKVFYELTLYGLPMPSVAGAGTSASQPASVDILVNGTDLDKTVLYSANGEFITVKISVDVAEFIQKITDKNETYYTIDGFRLHDYDDMPLVPVIPIDITIAGQKAHGVALINASFNETKLDKQYCLCTPVVTGSSNFTTSSIYNYSIYPAKIVGMTRIAGRTGTETTALITPVQHVASTNAVKLYDHVEVEAYFSTSDDFNIPVISTVEHIPPNPSERDLVTINALVMDDVGVSMVKLYSSTDGINWNGTDMSLVEGIWQAKVVMPNVTLMYFVRAWDSAGNLDESDVFSIFLTADTTPPTSITNLTNVTGQTWINWTWTNPPDADFNHTIVYLNGTWQTNTSNPYYNATGLIQNTYYEIGTHTADKVGNVNITGVNQTAKTQAENIPPTAIIDSITPDPAEQGTDTVFFTGHGNDSDGSVIAYNWRSCIDGQLSTSASFSKPASDLSVGTHTIYFMVQDNDGAWSTEDTEDLTINPSPTVDFDTGVPANPYPSIMGTHNGMIKPNQTITVHKMYTYPCSGTGGHSEHIRIWNDTWIGKEAHWKGYKDDWHNITFDDPFTLFAEKTYNYEIRTGSYPQIIHKSEHTTLDGSFINCTNFIDANGKEYTNWIPAIKSFL